MTTEETQTQITETLLAERPDACRRLQKLMDSETAWETGRVDAARERLMTWADNRIIGADALTLIQIEEAVEEAADRAPRA